MRKFKLIINSASKQVASLWFKFIDLDELFLETKFFASKQVALT